jgi:hypothetical protein
MGILLFDDLPGPPNVRASNEGSPRPRVARVQKIISLHPLFSKHHPNPQFHFEGSLVDPRLRASNDIYAPSKLARYLSGMGAV